MVSVTSWRKSIIGNMYKKVDNFFQGSGTPFLISEIGKNFIQSRGGRPISEYLQNAKVLIKAAKEAGADAVKFQIHNVEDEQLNISVESPHFKAVDRYSWVKRNTEITPLSFWQELKEYANELGIIFFVTPMSRGAAERIASIDIPIYKVGSGDLLDFVLLDYLTKTGKPILLSTGMSTEEEIDKAVEFLKKRNAHFTLLHCVSKYPTPLKEQFIETMLMYKRKYQVPIGFSSHSLDIESAIAAAGVGAVCIEKHLSLDRNLFGSDHKVSLLPKEFKEMTDRIRSFERIDIDRFGKGIKILDASEAEFRPIFRKTLIYGQNLKKGVLLNREVIYAMRPQLASKGLPSERFEVVLGKRLIRDVKKYEPILIMDFI